MATPRLLVTDVDRTLLTHDYRLPQRVADSIQMARAAGLIVVLATARSPEGVKPYAERLGVSNLAVCFNGAWTGNVSTGVAARTEQIARDLALQAMAAAAQTGLKPMWFAEGAIHVLEDHPALRREAEITGETMLVARDSEALPGRPGKIMCVAPLTSMQSAFETMRAAFDEQLSVSGSHPRLLEIGPKGASKRAAAVAIAKELGIDRMDCAAAGDAENDLELLAWAGTAVTVANAVPEARRLAGFIAPSCDEGGLAEAVAWLRQGKSAVAAD